QVVLSADGREQLRSADGRDRARHTEDHSRHGPTPHLAQRRGTRRTPLCPPFARGEKRPDAADFPPLAKGGWGGGESRGACNASENRSNRLSIEEMVRLCPRAPRWSIRPARWSRAS